MFFKKALFGYEGNFRIFVSLKVSVLSCINGQSRKEGNGELTESLCKQQFLLSSVSVHNKDFVTVDVIDQPPV